MSEAAASAIIALTEFNKTLRESLEVPRKPAKKDLRRVRVKICDVLTGYKLAAIYRGKMYFLEELHGSYKEAEAAVKDARKKIRQGKIELPGVLV